MFDKKYDLHLVIKLHYKSNFLLFIALIIESFSMYYNNKAYMYHQRYHRAVLQQKF
jgi:hypothetical protein